MTSQELNFLRSLVRTAQHKQFFVVDSQREDDTQCDTTKLWEWGTFTVSPERNKDGWITDCGCSGYGIPESAARYLCEAANALPFLLNYIDRLHDELDL